MWDVYVTNGGTIVVEVVDYSESGAEYTCFESVDLVTWESVAEPGEGIEFEPPSSDGGAVTYEIEDNSVYYSDTYLRVSVDSRESRHQASLGTNYGRKILIDGDTVWVASFGYHAEALVIYSDMIGGGLHRFEWSYE